MLKRWLEYSASGVLDGGIKTEREPDSDFEIFVIHQLKAMGFDAVPQVGVAGYFVDIGVRHPDWRHGYVLGVETENAALRQQLIVLGRKVPGPSSTEQ
jgi:hypothetical protein